MRRLIHFAHGNGFPALCYSQLLAALKPQFDCCFIDRIGHNPQFPVTENWHFLVDEIIDSVQRQAREPVIAIGHSLGGVLSFMAAIEKPEYFKAVIMLDSPLINSFKSQMLRFAKVFGVIDRITPAMRTRGRRQFWQNQDQLHLYLQTRDLFKTFSPECLQDYMAYGLDKNETGFHLRFDRSIEYLIYRTIPHVLPKYKGKLQRPAALIYGDKSKVVDTMDRKYMQKGFGVKCFSIPGTHLFPLENPKMTAEKIIQAIDAILS